eukprot:COSAG01_NODE_28311_length_664_cov_0.791150_1_plen_178_part_10
MYTESMKSGVLSHDHISLACGWGWVIFFVAYTHPSSLAAANDVGVFSSALNLYDRCVDLSTLPVSWWEETCRTVDVASARAMAVWSFFGSVKRLPAAPQSAIKSSWWSELLDQAIQLVKLNGLLGLSGRDTMCFCPIIHALGIVELAAQDESQHSMLLECGVADALEYAVLHDFTYVG